MLNKKEPFAECLGTLVSKVKYIQNDNAYNARGDYLGRMDEGKLNPKGKVSTKKVDHYANKYLPEVLNNMDRPELLAFALSKYKTKLKGNESSANLRLAIRTLEANKED